MIIRCQFCETRFRIPDDKLPPAGTLVRCSSCRATFWVNPSALAQEQDESCEEEDVATESSPASANAGLDIDGLLGGAPPTPPPSSIQAPTDDSWWDLPEINQDGPPPPQETAPEDSWLDLPELPSHTVPQPTPNKPPSGEPKGGLLSMEPTPPPGVLGGVLGPGPGQEPAQAPKPVPAGPNVPPQEEEAHSAEFLLRDRTQQRQEFWYTAVPLVVRSFFLVGFLFVFAWLWTSLEHGTFTGKSLQWKRLKSTFVGESSHWNIRNVRYQWRQHKKGQYLVIQGKLRNTHNQTQREPDLQIRYTHTTVSQHSRKLRCCRQPTPTRLHAIQTSGQVRGWQNSLRSTRRKQLAAGKTKTFALLWIPPKGVKSIEVRVYETKSNQRTKPKRTKPKRAQPRPKVENKKRPKDSDDDSDDDDDDSED